MKDQKAKFNQAKTEGIDFAKNFFQLSPFNQGVLHGLAIKWGYKRPKNANGSTSRYFYALLKRRYYKVAAITEVTDKEKI